MKLLHIIGRQTYNNVFIYIVYPEIRKHDLITHISSAILVFITLGRTLMAKLVFTKQFYGKVITCNVLLQY